MHSLGGSVGNLDYGEVVTMMYLKIALSDYLTLFNARTKGWCWMNAPSKVLLAAAAIALFSSTMLAAYWPEDNKEEMCPISWALVLFVWVYTFLWSFVQDAGKIVCYWAMEKTGMIKTTEVITAKDLEGLNIRNKGAM